MKFKSIHNKLNLFSFKLLIMATLAMVAMAVTTGYILNNQSNTELGDVIKKNLITKGNLQLDNVSSRMVALLEDNSFSAIEELYSSVLQNDSDFVCANYVDVDNKQWLTIDYTKRTSKIDVKESSCIVPNDSVTFTILETDSSPVYLFNSVVKDEDDEKLGNILIVISSENMINTKRNSEEMLLKSSLIISVSGIVIFSAIIFLVGFVMSKRFAKQFTEPLNKLESHAKEIASGNYNTLVDVDTNDEVGILADELEKMRNSIFEDKRLMKEMVEDGEQKLYEINSANQLSQIVSEYQNVEIAKMQKIFEMMSNGNLDIIYNIGKHDDSIKDVAHSFDELSIKLNNSVEKLSSLIGKVKSIGENVEGSSQLISSKYETLTTSFYDIKTRSDSVNGISSEVHSAFRMIVSEVSEISDNISVVNSETQQMSFHMDEVKTFLEEIIKVINTLTLNYKEVETISLSAVEQSKFASKNIEELETSADEIGNVTDIIKKIADQTNLLALNATIEAASAGEAGKGFSVVASEIKELANQSAKAAEDIYDRINQMQQSTKISVNTIKNVSETINQIKVSSENVTTDITNLTSASTSISDRINLSAEGIDRIATSIESLTSSTNDVSTNASTKNESVNIMVNDISEVITSVDTGMNNLIDSSSEIENIVKISSMLKNILKEFKVKKMK